MAQIPLRDQEYQLKIRKLCLASENLKGVTVAIHVTDGFEQMELTKTSFDQTGAQTQVVSPKDNQVGESKFAD